MCGVPSGLSPHVLAPVLCNARDHALQIHYAAAAHAIDEPGGQGRTTSVVLVYVSEHRVAAGFGQRRDRGLSLPGDAPPPQQCGFQLLSKYFSVRSLWPRAVDHDRVVDARALAGPSSQLL